MRRTIPAQRCYAFTLVELLVVIAIIGILVSLLLPAVQSVREAARRTECANNLRQISLATHSYTTIKRRYPPGWLATATSATPGWGWMSYLLPHIEQDNVHVQIDFKENLLMPDHEQLVKSTFPGILCPTSTHATTSFELETTSAVNGSFVDIGRTHYVGCIGSAVEYEEMDSGEFCPSINLLGVVGEYNGVYFENSRTRLVDVVDGSSNTIIVGERSAPIFDSTWIGVAEGSPYTGWRVVGWTGEPVNYKGGSDIHFHAYAQFNSMHPGGLSMFAFGDGSIRPIFDQIDIEVFHHLGTIAGGEFIPAF